MTQSNWGYSKILWATQFAAWCERTPFAYGLVRPRKGIFAHELAVFSTHFRPPPRHPVEDDSHPLMLRHPPAGVPVIEFRLRHASERAEAGATRRVEAEIDAVAFESQARLLAGAAGKSLKAEGFLCARSRRSTKPVLHVTNIEFTEGK